MRRLPLGIAALLLLTGGQDTAARQEPPAGRAVPRAAIAAIVEAYRQYRIVGLGDAHGNQLGEAFQLALVRDPGFRAVVNDIIVESGNSRHQELADRFIRGENVAPDALRPIWLDTTQQQAASLEVPELFTTVRTLNASAPPDQRLRILLGEPPIEWERMKTADDYKAWDDGPASSRDAFAAGLVRREVLAKNRRALVAVWRGALLSKSRQSVARDDPRRIADEGVHDLDERRSRVGKPAK
jgi:hypothetical protein